ncbi:MAG: hypothetical protein V3V14_06905 [Saprospiraceae bacterium]
MKTKLIVVDRQEIDVDSLTLIPATASVSINNVSIVDFSIQNNKLILGDSIFKSIVNDTISINYRTFLFDIERKYFHLDSSMMTEKNRAIIIDSEYNSAKNKSGIIDANGLNYNGSFSRGFSVGNSQSLVLNSNFNLQLIGDLGNGVNIVAAISDDNIPIQPQGNTQLIQEFDKVFIKVSKGKTSVIAGDYNLTRPNSYFINYQKKLKGISIANTTTLNGEKSLTSNGNFAISRGKFTRQNLVTSEGNQGPYKLTGANNERFLIVLSGSERIYIDGQLLKRGLDYDYIIDYNRAEITFTPLRIIGRESRIIVEYEYRDQNYLRSVYAFNTNLSTPKYNINLNFYNEQDSKNVTGDIVLDSSDVNLLSSIGDNLNQAQVSTLRSANDTLLYANQVKYKLNSAVLPGDPNEYYLEYSTDLAENLFVASFSETEKNHGRYIIDNENLINGRVYKYVGPNKGSYEPVTTLIPPNKTQIISMGIDAHPNENINIGSELSVSNLDKNRFSDINNDDNVGWAGKLNYSHKIFLKDKTWQLKTVNLYEHRNQNFNEINPYRKAEFARDWNLNQKNITGEQNLYNAQLILSNKKAFRIGYNFNHFNILQTYAGSNHSTNVQLNQNGFVLNGSYDALNTKGFGENTIFKRPKFELTKSLLKSKELIIGIKYDGESNKRYSNSTAGNLLNTSTAYDAYNIHIGNSLKNKIHYKLQFTNRNDLFPDMEELIKSINTKKINTTIHWKISPVNNLKMNFGVRDFNVLRADLLTQNIDSKKTIVGKLDYFLNIKNGFFVSSTTYLINSGQEPKVEYFFEQVEQGQGDYIYIGNQDSTLINGNFRYAPNLGTGNFIRLSLINNEFILTNNQTIAQSFRIDPMKILKGNTTKWSKIISKLYIISNIRIDKKIKDDGSNQSTTFLNFKYNDINLARYNSIINNSLFINKGKTEYDIQISQINSKNIFTQISGLEQRQKDEISIRSRIKIKGASDFILKLSKGTKSYNSTLYTDRNFKINSYQINPQISIRPITSLRFNIQYNYQNRKQMISNMETAISKEFALNTTYSKVSRTSINFSLSYIDVKYSGKKDSQIEFDLLEGLKNGKNYLWNTNITKKLSKSLDLNISYEGRINGAAPTVHIARAQVKATF